MTPTGRACPGPLRVLTVAALLGLAGCQAGPRSAPTSPERDNSHAVAALQRVNETGMRCWIRSSDAAFRNLHFVPELDTSVGRPRLLLLERGKVQGLPVLVIEASGTPATVSTYGPLAATPTGRRVDADIRRWSSGNTACQD